MNERRQANAGGRAARLLALLVLPGLLVVLCVGAPAAAGPRVICDNDGDIDNYLQEYCLALASAGEIELLALVGTRVDVTQLEQVSGKAARSGIQTFGIELLQGVAGRALLSPDSGLIDDTVPFMTDASDRLLTLIDDRGTSIDPIVYVAAGPLTSVANAYLLGQAQGKPIADKLTLFASNTNVDDMDGYNGQVDGWAAYVALQRLSYRQIAVGEIASAADVSKTRLAGAEIPENELKRFMIVKDQGNGLPGDLDHGSPPALWSLLDASYATATKTVQFDDWIDSPNFPDPFFPALGDAHNQVPGFQDAACTPGPGCAVVVTAVDAQAGTDEWWRALSQPVTWTAPVKQQAPFGDGPILADIGMVVQAQDFDWGGQERNGFGAYHDTTPGATNDLRAVDGVDLEPTDDATGDYHIGGIEAGEWFEYDVLVPRSGTHDLTLRVSSDVPSGTLRILLDGVDVSGGLVPVPWDASATWQDWTLEELSLTEGRQRMRIEVGVGGWRLNYFSFAGVLPDLCSDPVSNAAWTIELADSEQTAPPEDGSAARAIDGDPATAWVTRFDPTVDPLPHELWIDLGSEESFCALEYLGRQAGSTDGVIESYELYVKSGAPPSQPAIVESEWTLVSSGTFHDAASAPSSPVRRVIRQFGTATARYVRLKAISEISGQQISSANEIGLFRAGTLPAIVDVVPPAEVDNLRLAKSGNDAVLLWDDVTSDQLGALAGPLNYRVYSDATPAGAGTSIAGPAEDNEFTDVDALLDPNAEYYLVSAVNLGGHEGNLRPPAVQPPRGLTAVWDGSQVVLSWSGAEPTAEVSGYVAFWGGQSGEYDQRLNLANVTSVSVTPGTLDGEQYFTVVARDQQGRMSGPGEEARVELLSAGGTPPSITPLATPLANAAGWHNQDVTVSFTCGAGATCPPAVVITVEQAGRVISGTAVSPGGDRASATVTLNIDKTAPTLTPSVSPQANLAGWHSGDVTLTYACADERSGVASCPPTSVTTGSGAGLLVPATAIDVAGNQTPGDVSLNIDRTDPSVSISTPTDGATVGSLVAVSGTVSDDLALDTVDCNGVAAVVVGNDYDCDVPVPQGNQPITVVARDLAGNSMTAGLSVNRTVANPTVTVDTPTTGLVTTAGMVSVTGTFSDASAVVVNGVSASIGAGTWTATDVPLIEGTNTLVATASNDGAETASASVIVRRDTEPPKVILESPAANARLIDGTIAVAGTVNDVIPGATINADDVSVTVDIIEAGLIGLPAQVNNRTYFLSGLTLVPGTNTIRVEAVDQAGNVGETTASVDFDVNLLGVKLQLIAGNAQSGPIGSLLPAPLHVRAVDGSGQPMPNRLVEFQVSNGDGLLGDAANSKRKISMLTDAAGEAQVDFNLGSRTGMGFHRVLARTPGSLAFVEFCATAQTGTPVNVSIVLMSPMRGLVNEPVPMPLSVIVTDAGGNPVPGVTLQYAIDAGGGNLAGQPTQDVVTNPDGIAEATWTLGPDPTPSANVVSATFAGNLQMPAVFTATGVVSGPAAETRISGTVQNSAGEPIVGARVFVRDEDPPVETFTGQDGAFTITDVPPGGHHVLVEGSSANDPGSGIYFPDIEFAVEAISGADNRLEPPVVTLPFLDLGGQQLAGGATDVVLAMGDVPGFGVRIFAHSTYVRDPGTGQLVQQPVMMSSSQVKFDKVPMPPPQGSTPMIVGTLQPGGVRFDPPAQVTYPNVEGLAPGDVADVFAFHHDIGQFVNVGPATVSEDGTVAVSDPGFGIIQSGWHCMLRIPGPVAGCEGCGEECTDPGALSGGTVDVTNRMPMIGEQVTFSASGVVDSGGVRTVVCDDVSYSEKISPGAVSYEHTLTKPDGEQIMGQGGQVSVTTDAQCGDYVATFVAKTDRDCAAPPLTLPPVTASLDVDLGNEIAVSPIVIDFSNLEALLDFLRKAQIPGTRVGCQIEGPSDIPVVSLDVSVHNECCDGMVTQLDRWSGSASLDTGTLSCRFPIPGLSNGVIGTVAFILDAGVAVSFNVNTPETCDDRDGCFELSVSPSISPGLEGSLGPGGIAGSLSASFEVDATGSGEYCIASRSGSAEICASIGVKIKVGVLADLLSHTVTFELAEGCFPPIYF